MKVLVKEGWADKETGKKGEPRLQFMLVQYLQDVLTSFAKKLIINVDIKQLEADMIHKLSHVFQSNKGDNTVSFEVLETESVKRTIVADAELVVADEIVAEDNLDAEPEINVATEIEETRIITKLAMPSRKLKVKICGELLQELEKMDIHFKLN